LHCCIFLHHDVTSALVGEGEGEVLGGKLHFFGRRRRKLLFLF
jgi:hypothetical protein